MTKPFQIAVFASGSGTNAERIIRYFQHHPSISVSALLSNNPHAYALQRAKNLNVETKLFDKLEFKEGTDLLAYLDGKKITHIVLAGFLWLIPDYLIRHFPDRIINIHPALLPKYGGKGMYGLKVHEAVKTAGDKESGITIHLVNEKYDEGKILFQAKCEISAGLSPEEIAGCIHQLEYEHYPKVIENWILKNS